MNEHFLFVMKIDGVFLGLKNTQNECLNNLLILDKTITILGLLNKFQHIQVNSDRSQQKSIIIQIHFTLTAATGLVKR